jgi:hypothetical protein
VWQAAAVRDEYGSLWKGQYNEAIHQPNYDPYDVTVDTAAITDIHVIFS